MNTTEKIPFWLDVIGFLILCTLGAIIGYGIGYIYARATDDAYGLTPILLSVAFGILAGMRYLRLSLKG